MIKKSLRKNIVREMRSTLSRFLAIFAITALGAGFFAGLRATSPNMMATANQYYQAQHLMDYRLLSTMGFTQDDVDALRKVEGVQHIMATQRLDILAESGEWVEPVRLLGLPKNTSPDNPEYLNRLTLSEGRLPTAWNECVVDEKTSYKLGDTIIVSEQNTPETLDFLHIRQFVVVGKARSPLYVTFQRGNTNIGDGRLSYFVYVPHTAFDTDVYTEIFISTSNPASLSSFSSQYKSQIENGLRTLETFGETRAQIRYDTIYANASKELADARTKLAEARKEADEKFGEALQKLQDAEKELADAEQKTVTNSKKLEDAKAELASGESSLAAGKAQINAKQAEFDAGVAQYNAQLAAYNSAYSQFATQQQEYDTAVAQFEGLYQALDGLDSAGATLGILLPLLDGTPAGLQAEADFLQTAAGAKLLMQQLAAGLGAAGFTPLSTALTGSAAALQAALDTADYATAAAVVTGASAPVRPVLDAAKAQLMTGLPLLQQAAADLVLWKSELDNAAATIAAGKTALESGWAQINAADATLADARVQLQDGQRKLQDAKVKLRNARIELTDGKAEYQQNKTEAEQKFADAEVEIADGEEKLAQLKLPEWFVSKRDSNPGYTGFATDAGSIRAIAESIPTFFYLVAALVCLTTMTRMVEEQRTQIGTLKALGFGKGSIAFKYISYAAAASVLGSSLGVFVGVIVFPNTIWGAYQMLYAMPALAHEKNINLALISISVSVLCTTLATVAACFSELRSVPAELMRPKAPRAGTRVLLEHIPFIWNHLSFSIKVTARNLFRYKKRFFMTVLGVAGCAALLLTGFGLRDSIRGIVPLQYGSISKYDIIAALSETSSAAEDTPLNKVLPTLGSAVYTYSAPIDAKNGSNNNAGLTTSLYVVEQPETISDFFDFHERASGEAITFPQVGGVIITEKLAQRLKLKVGDTFEFNRVDEASVQVAVAGIMENYVQNAVYMSPSTYENLYFEPPAYSSLLLVLPQDSTLPIEDALATLVDTEGVAGAVDISSLKSQLADMLENLDSVIWLIILSAGMLAVVVLYNLTNINITERRREIATLKVLGFFDGEVASYVYRENFLLTLIGAAVGLVLGIFLHRFVITTVEVDEVMFRRVILWTSYAWSIVFTLLCAILVNIIMMPRLKQIDMVESLKSAE